MFRCKHSKGKAKKMEVTFQVITNTYDVPLRCVYAITSFEAFVRNQPVFCPAVMCLVLGDKVSYLYDRLKIVLKSRWGSGTWLPMASLRHNSHEAPCLLYIFSSVGEEQIIKFQVQLRFTVHVTRNIMAEQIFFFFFWGGGERERN